MNKRILRCILLSFLQLLVMTVANSMSLTPTKEQNLGDKALREIRNSSDLIADPIANDYVKKIGERLSRAADDKNKMNFFIINNPVMNAFTVPNGIVVIHSGLIITVDSEDELASVMAHEAAHVAQKHISRSMDEASGAQIPAVAATVAAIALGIAMPAAGAAAMALTSAGYVQNALNFTRVHEKEADRVGMKLLTKAGYDASAMPKVFQKFAKQEQFYPAAPQTLQTHPFSEFRIADTENRLLTTKPQHHAPSLRFYLVQARVRALTTANRFSLRSYFRNAQAANRYEAMANQYGYAMTELTLNNPQQAADILKPLLEQAPEEPLLWMLQAEILSQKKQWHDATVLLQKINHSHENYLPLQIAYGQALLDEGNFLAARNFLKVQVRHHPAQPEFYLLLAKAEAKTGNLAMAYYTQAQLYYLLGDSQEALQQLSIGLRQKHIDVYAKSMLMARMMQIKNGNSTGIAVNVTDQLDNSNYHKRSDLSQFSAKN